MIGFIIGHCKSRQLLHADELAISYKPGQKGVCSPDSTVSCNAPCWSGSTSHCKLVTTVFVALLTFGVLLFVYVQAPSSLVSSFSISSVLDASTIQQRPYRKDDPTGHVR